VLWLQKGLNAVDPKLRLIAALNENLAHKTWMIDFEDVGVIIHQVKLFQALLSA
jgi:hypothetical protein